jgi:hypothetical protein
MLTRVPTRSFGGWQAVVVMVLMVFVSFGWRGAIPEAALAPTNSEPKIERTTSLATTP